MNEREREKEDVDVETNQLIERTKRVGADDEQIFKRKAKLL